MTRASACKPIPALIASESPPIISQAWRAITVAPSRERTKPGLADAETRGSPDRTRGWVMQWAIRLEAVIGWGDTQTYEIGTISPRVTGLGADEVGLLLDERKAVLAELRRRMVQNQIDEQVTCARVCFGCSRMRRIRDRRTRTLQTLFGTVTQAVRGCIRHWAGYPLSQ